MNAQERTGGGVVDGTGHEQGNGGGAPAGGRYVVFCADREVCGEEGYIFFTHASPSGSAFRRAALL